MNVSKEKSSIQSEYVRRGKRKTGASSHYARRPFRAKSHPDTEKDSILSVCSRPFTRRSHRLDTALIIHHLRSEAYHPPFSALAAGIASRVRIRQRILRRKRGVRIGSALGFIILLSEAHYPLLAGEEPLHPAPAILSVPRYGKRLLRLKNEEAVCIAQSFLNQRYSPVTGSISPFWRAGTPAMMA